MLALVMVSSYASCSPCPYYALVLVSSFACCSPCPYYALVLVGLIVIMDAVYYYFRSLAVRQPILTARDGLTNVYEKVRLKQQTQIDDMLMKRAGHTQITPRP